MKIDNNNTNFLETLNLSNSSKVYDYQHLQEIKGKIVLAPTENQKVDLWQTWGKVHSVQYNYFCCDISLENIRQIKSISWGNISSGSGSSLFGISPYDYIIEGGNNPYLRIGFYLYEISGEIQKIDNLLTFFINIKFFK